MNPGIVMLLSSLGGVGIVSLIGHGAAWLVQLWR